MNLESFIGSVTVTAKCVEEVDRAAVGECLERHGVVNVRGLIDPQSIVTVKARLRGSFDPENDNPATGESPAQLYENFQKFSVNGGEFRANAYPQCVRTFYNPLFADDVYGMREGFRQAAKLRNLLMGVALDWATDKIDDGFWTASRIHHYPAGGGFMAKHCEDYVPQFYVKHGLENAYYQPLIVMSRKGQGQDCDYDSGGGYFELDDEKQYFEAWCELGDVVIYDTRVYHGVTEIDIRKPFRPNRMEGRFAGFVTLYRDLREEAS